MNALHATEAINFEQLATPTDRLLLRCRSSERRASTPRIIFPLLDVDSSRSPTQRQRCVDAWRTFTYRALIIGVLSVTASIASLL